MRLRATREQFEERVRAKLLAKQRERVGDLNPRSASHHTRATRGELVDMCDIFRCKVADVSEDTVTIEVSGKVSKITAMQSLLEPYGILEVARSGRVALPRDSGVDSKLLAAIEDEGDLEFE